MPGIPNVRHIIPRDELIKENCIAFTGGREVGGRRKENKWASISILPSSTQEGQEFGNLCIP